MEKFLRAGDTWEWSKSLPAYPSGSGWTLSYVFYRFGNAPITVTATGSGSDYSVKVAPDVTGRFAPGPWKWSAHVVNVGGDRYTVEYGDIVIKPNLASATPTADYRTQVEAMLEEVESALRRLTSREVDSVTVDGKTVTYANRQDLISFRNKLLRERQMEQDAEKVASGESVSRKIYTRFR